MREHGRGCKIRRLILSSMCSRYFRRKPPYLGSYFTCDGSLLSLRHMFQGRQQLLMRLPTSRPPSIETFKNDGITLNTRQVHRMKQQLFQEDMEKPSEIGLPTSETHKCIGCSVPAGGQVSAPHKNVRTEQSNRRHLDKVTATFKSKRGKAGGMHIPRS